MIDKADLLDPEDLIRSLDEVDPTDDYSLSDEEKNEALIFLDRFSSMDLKVSAAIEDIALHFKDRPFVQYYALFMYGRAVTFTTVCRYLRKRGHLKVYSFGEIVMIGVRNFLGSIFP